MRCYLFPLLKVSPFNSVLVLVGQKLQSLYYCADKEV